MENNKQLATEFLQMVVDGKIDEAYQKYVDMSGKHHNMFFAAGLPALLEAMKDNQKQMPNKKFTVKHVLGDGDLVAAHSHIEIEPFGPAGGAAVHLFRFRAGKIIEMWDVSQQIPPDSPNRDGAF